MGVRKGEKLKIRQKQYFKRILQNTEQQIKFCNTGKINAEHTPNPNNNNKKETTEEQAW